jgi:preprotein translocase subunit SecA
MLPVACYSNNMLYINWIGMTGTADTEAYEFNIIYGLEGVVVPKPLLMTLKTAMNANNLY